MKHTLKYLKATYPDKSCYFSCVLLKPLIFIYGFCASKLFHIIHCIAGTSQTVSFARSRIFHIATIVYSDTDTPIMHYKNIHEIFEKGKVLQKELFNAYFSTLICLLYRNKCLWFVQLNTLYGSYN